MRILPLLLALAACGESVPPELSSQRDEARTHYRAGDYAAWTTTLEAATAEDPRPRDVYNLACGYALTGQPDKAMERLSWLVDRNKPYHLLDDEDLDSLREREDFKALVKRLNDYDRASEHLVDARRLALKHYKAGDHEAFIVIMEKLAPLSDAHIDTYNLACAYALSGREDEAIGALEKLADIGVDYGASDDPDFAALRDDPRFKAVLERMDG